MTIIAAEGTFNNTSGNGQFSSLKRNVKKENNKKSSDILDKNDRRMRFRNSMDPIYVAYEYVDNQPISKLATSFVKESLFEIASFISKAVKAA